MVDRCLTKLIFSTVGIFPVRFFDCFSIDMEMGFSFVLLSISAASFLSLADILPVSILFFKFVALYLKFGILFPCDPKHLFYSGGSCAGFMKTIFHEGNHSLTNSHVFDFPLWNFFNNQLF